MKKIFIFSTLILLLTSLSACSSSENNFGDTNKQPLRPENQATQFLSEYVKSEWLKILPEYNLNKIEKTKDTLSYQYGEEKKTNSRIKKLLTYTRNDTGTFQGTLKLDLGGKSNEYTLNIPKDFASHVDKLVFSIEPSKIINPDPIVEFSETSGEIVIDSSETKTENEIDASLVRQIIDTESKICESLPIEESISCTMSLISKYRDSKYLEEELSNINMGDLLGGSAQAVLQSDIKLCRHVVEPNEKKLCYEYAYQALVKDCDKLNGKSYRTCVRELSAKMPSMKEQKLFCGYIKNEEMRNECQGTAPFESCDEIEDKEQKNECQLNILKTNNDLTGCSKIDDPFYQEVCRAVIGSSRKDQAICMKLDDEYIRDLCLTKIALASHKKSICSKIEDADAKDLCHAHFIMKSEVSEEMCQNTHALFLKELCQLALAVKNKDSFKCANPKIVGYDNQPICYLGMAIMHNDAELCNKININTGEAKEDKKISEESRDACFHQIALKKPDASLCERIIDDEKVKNCKNDLSSPAKEIQKTDEEKLTEYPPIPDWMDCPTPKGALLKNIGGGQTSGFYYYSPKTRGNVGPEMRWWGANFDQPYRFVCRNAEGEKNGPYKEWNQNGSLSSEGAYQDGKLHGEIKSYSNSTLHVIETYENGVLNGYYEKYCTSDGKNCKTGDIIKSGIYVNEKKNGFWSTYKFGELEFKEEYIDGEVTRDKNGRNIKYNS